MNRTIIVGVFACGVALLAPQIATAQGTITFLSNLSQTPAGSNPAGSDSWLAAGFLTGNNAGGYSLNSIQLGLTDASGNPSGFIVMLYSAAGHGNVSPGDSLGALNGSADPAIGGIYSYAPTVLVSLLPNTPYFIVLTDETSVANGAYEWSYAGAFSYNPSGGWQAPVGGIAVDNYESSDGLNWTYLGGPPQFAINATPTPEPGVIGLFALGGLLVAFRRRNKSTARPNQKSAVSANRSGGSESPCS
jgi:PEP-CTERM motif